MIRETLGDRLRTLALLSWGEKVGLLIFDGSRQHMRFNPPSAALGFCFTPLRYQP